MENKSIVVIAEKELDLEVLVRHMNDKLRESLNSENFENNQVYIECYVQRAFREDPDFIKVLESKFNVATKELDPYEEALVIQENHGLLSNVVAWENEEFLNALKENDPEDYHKFLTYKRIYEQQESTERTNKRMKKSFVMER